MIGPIFYAQHKLSGITNDLKKVSCPIQTHCLSGLASDLIQVLCPEQACWLCGLTFDQTQTIGRVTPYPRRIFYFVLQDGGIDRLSRLFSLFKCIDIMTCCKS
ncbi:unnamed protein product [Lymnaea stagnalis]|uniref:Uncharacterized protein n=1 Tax=Lymnaea stagnalis TaxID=6523 RepID=A0AAV2ILX0_LYMST